MQNRLADPSFRLVLIMLIAYILRVLLIVNGGQLYHPDELRYYRSIEATKHIFNGDVKNTAKVLLKYEFHQGIATAKLVPALFHRFIHNLNHDDNLLWKDLWHTPPQNFRLPALIFALPSVLSIGMIYAIQRRAGADEAEALLGAFLMAASHSFFFFAKHLLPFDISLLIGLVAIYFAVRQPVRRIFNAVWIGWLIFLAFWIYNGYASFVIIISLLYCVFLAKGVRETLHRSLGMAAGALLFFLPIFAMNLVLLEENIIVQMRAFSETINHGTFSEGIIFPFIYFSNIEGAISVIWLVGLVMAGWRIWRQPPSLHRHRATQWFVCLIGLYLFMSLLSTGLQQFVVYGRVARSLLPFVVMICAFAFSPFLQRYGRRASAVFVAAISFLAMTNFVPAIQQQYPLEIAWQVYQEYDDVSFEATVATTANPPFPWWRLQPELPNARYRLLNAAHYYPITGISSDLPAGKVILEIPHPLHYKPWQYEGLTPEERELVNRSDFKIWLIDTQKAAE